MPDFYDKYLCFGVTEDMDPQDARAITIINKFCMISILIWGLVIGVILTAVPEESGKIPFYLGNMAFDALIIYLNMRRRYVIAKAIVVWDNVLTVLAVNLLYGAESMAILHYTLIAILVALIYKKKRRILLYFSIIAAAFAFSLWYQAHYPPLAPPSETFLLWGRYLSIICCFLLAFYSVLLFKQINADYESMFMEKNRLLTEKNRQVKCQRDELRASRERYASLIETMNEGFAMLDCEGRITYVNRKLSEMSGRAPEEMLGYSPDEFTEEPERTDFLQNFEMVTQAGTREAWEKSGVNLEPHPVRYRKKDGSIRNVIVAPCPTYDEAGKVDGAFAVITDIHEMKVAQDALNVRNEELKTINEELNATNEELKLTLDQLREAQMQLVESEKMASLGQLTAGVAHEINNPINFVSGNVEPLRLDFADLRGLLERYRSLHSANGSYHEELARIAEYEQEVEAEALFEEVVALLNGIDEGASRTKEIVNGLRAFSRFEESKFKRVNLHDGIEATLVILRHQLGDRIGVEKDYSNLPHVEALGGRLNQVFMNLISNAAQAIEGSGTIRIGTRQLDEETVRVSVADSGPGISKEATGRLFEPFFTTKEVGKGTGLGLSIVYGIVRQHGGRIEGRNLPEGGAEFVLDLPVSQSKAVGEALQVA